MDFRDALKLFRREVGVAQVDIAAALHINISTVARWEQGKNIPTRSFALALLDYAKSKSASSVCIENLEKTLKSEVKKRLLNNKDNLFSVEHSTISQLIEGATSPIYVCDINTDEVLYINGAMEKILGKSLDDLSGKKCFEGIMGRNLPCDFCHKQELVKGGFKEYEVVLPLDEALYHVRGKLVKWNGHSAQARCMFAKSLPVEANSKNKIVGVSTGHKRNNVSTEWYIEKDVENEKEIRQLMPIFDNINSGVSVVIFEENGAVRVAYANDRYYQLFGYTREQFFKEMKDPHDTTYAEDREKTAAAMAKVKKTRQAQTFRYRVVKRDKSIAHLSCSSSITTIEGVKGFAFISILTDITDYVQTEQQSIVYGQRLEAIMNNMNSAVTASIIKKDGAVEFLFSNDLYHEMLGYTKEQYQEEVKELSQCIFPQDLKAVQQVVFSLKKEGDAKELQYRVLTRDGKIKWIKERITMMRFPDADALVHLSVYLDITDIVKAQETISAQRDQIEELLNNTPGGIAIIEVNAKDIAGTMRTTYYNDRFFGFSGYERDEYDAMIKKNELIFVYEEDRPILMEDMVKLCSGEIGVSVDSSVRCHRKNGEMCWLLLTAQLTERKGDKCVINIAVMDITEKQEAIDRQRINEEMLRIAAETDQRYIIIYDAKKNSCRVESRRLFSARYGDVFENIPQSLIDVGLIAKESQDELRSLFTRINNGETSISVSLQMHNGPDKYEWFECNATTILDVEGTPDHAVMAFHNIMDERIKESVFKKWQQSIDARPVDSYTLFRLNLSRNASLDGQNGNLLKIFIDSDAMTFDSRVKYYSEECVSLEDRDEYVKLLDVNILLAKFFRGEHSATLDYREVLPNGEVCWRRLTIEMVEYPNSTDVQAFLMYEDIDEKKKAEIAEMEFAKSDPLTGALNRGAFAEKVEDIIRKNPNTNSALLMVDLDGFKKLNDTFGHAAGDQALQDVTAVLRSCSANKELVCRLGGDEFLVWLNDIPYDAVIGKTAQQMCEHIRKAYSQDVLLSASIGIAVFPRDGQTYEELYRNADKALYKVKEAGKGTFDFFSAIKEENANDVKKALEETQDSSPTPISAKHRMLIVDDDETNRLILQNIFKDEYLIETAQNGTEAMIRIRHFGNSISVVLLDLMMPDIDGFAVLRRMQNDIDLQTIPVIVVTGKEDHKTLLEVFELGAAEYVTKPIDVELIRTRVQSVVSKAENERLRAQNSYLMLQRDEEVKYRTVLESTGTALVEYDWRNHVYTYDVEISKRIAGKFDNRGLWRIFLSDMVADSADIKELQETMLNLGSTRDQKSDSKLVKLKTNKGLKHWFRVNFYKTVDDFGLAEKMIITFNDVHEEVLANEKLLFQATRDELTGLYNRSGFLEKAAELINKEEAGYYVMACIDIEKFQVINDRFGTEKGDEVLKHIATSVGGFVERNNGICCRYTADRFAVLYPAWMIGSEELESNHKLASTPRCINRPLRLRIGRCIVKDKTLPVSAMFDRATIAEAHAKGRYDQNIIDYDESMRDQILKEQQIVGDMVEALQKGEFEPWFQPQYNHATGAIIGAEALVRWRKDGKIVPPNDFVPIFERNGFIYEVDRYIWRKVCELLRQWLDLGKKPLPVSVNISRYDLLQKDFMDTICSLTKEFKLPVDLLRLEVTESAFSMSSQAVYAVVNKLIDKGYTVEIDDFGSGYSSLNTLKDVPASILKLDMRFFEKTGDAKRGGNIVESVVRMAKWLGMAVIAEGVEDKAQADYLKSIGCIYIQGYYYAKPMPTEEYEKRLDMSAKEVQLSHMQTLKNMDNNDFWDAHSMDTLIFNSYVGSACIMEFCKGKVEMLRATDHYVETLCENKLDITEVLAIDWTAHMDSQNIAQLEKVVSDSIETKEAVTWEFEFHNLPKCPETVILRSTMRVIAVSGDHILIYCLNDNITKQRMAEREVRETNEHINAVMDHAHVGICAAIARQDGSVQLIFVNNRFFDILGYTREQYAKEVKSPYDRVVPEDRERVFNEIVHLNEEGRTISLELREIRRDGSIVWLRCDASVVRFANISEPIQLTNFMDITEQKEAELKQLESAHKLEIIMSNVNGGVSAIQVFDDATSKIIFYNDKYYELYGYTREEAIAEKLDVMKLIFPEDLKDVMSKIHHMREDRQPCIIDYRITKKNGDYAMLRINASMMSLSGYGDDVITGVVTDITERKDLEERLSAIIDNINGGISAVYLKNDRTEYALANEQYYKILGYSKKEFEEENVNPFDLLHPDDIEWVKNKFNEMQKFGDSYSMEYRIIRRDGKVRNILCNTSVLKLFGRDEPLQLAVTNDITELREAQRKELAISERLSTVMNTMSDGMTAVAFHDNSAEFLFANNRFYEMFGIEHSSIGKMNLSNTLNILLPKYRADVRKLLLEAVKTMKSTSMEYQINHPDGSVRWIRATINMTKLKDIDAPVQVSLLKDITEEKKANEQIQFLSESASDILAQPNSEKAIKNTLHKLLNFFAGDRAYVFELNDVTQTSNNTYEICAEGVTAEIEMLQNVPYSTQQYWFNVFYKTGFVVIDDVLAIDDSKKDMREILQEQNIRSIIVAPLWRDGKLIGYIGIDNPTVAIDQVSQLIALSDYIAVLLTRRDLVRKIKQDSENVQQLVDDVPGGFVRMELFEDRNPTILSVNKGICKMLDMTREDLLDTYGDNVFACLADDDAAVAGEEIADAYASGEQYTSTCRLRKKDGSLFWVMLFGRFVKGDEGRLYLNAYFTDITEEKSVEQLQTELLDNLPFGTAMYEYDGKVLTAIHINKQYSELVNRVVDITVGGYVPMDAIYADDRRVVFNEIKSAIKENRKASCDVRLLYGKDEYRYFHVDATITPKDDKYILYVTYEPMSDSELELKEATEQLKLLSNSIPGGIATFRCMPGKIEPIYYNDGICTLTGYAREEFDNNNISVMEMFFKEDLPIIRKQIELLIRGEKVLDYSVRIHTKNGGYKWVECVANVTGKEGGKVFFVSAVLTDVTTQQEEREKLRVSEELNRLAIDQSGKIITRYDVSARTLTLPYTLPDIYNIPRVLHNMPEEQIQLGRISPDTADVYCKMFDDINKGVPSGEAVYQQNSTLGWRWLRTRFSTIFASDGKPIFAVASFEDITEQREKEAIYSRWQNTMAERELDSYTLVRCNLNKSNIVDSWDGNLLRIHFTNPLQSFNSRTDEYATKFVFAEDKRAFCAFLNSDTMLAEYHRGHRSDAMEYRENKDDGSVRWLRLAVDLVEYPDSKDVEAYLLFENIDEQKHSELSTIRKAETDPLTGVLNRTTFIEHVNQIIGQYDEKTCHALFMLDIDEFKKINDLFGHSAGDQALTDLANTLTRFCRKGDLVGRMGGDEFFVFIADIGSQKIAEKKASQLCDMARKKLGANLQISISIGVALFPQDGNNFEMLYKFADEELYRTKNAGKDGYSISNDKSVVGRGKMAEEKVEKSIEIEINKQNKLDERKGTNKNSQQSPSGGEKK